MSELFTLVPGDAPVIVNVPHAGTDIPADILATLTPAARAVPDTDWHVDVLYRDLCQARGITLMVARQSRIVVDLNRDPSGAALYPGASNTEICPISTFHEEAHYQPGHEPDSAEISRRVERYWRPYHQRLATELERVRARHGYCVLVDGHSIVSEAPRFFAGRLPDLNLGTADGASCEPRFSGAAMAVLSSAPGLSAVHNGRFKGGFITRHYGQPLRHVHALQLEMAQAAYLDEAKPRALDPVRAEPLVAVLGRLLDALLAVPRMAR